MIEWIKDSGPILQGHGRSDTKANLDIEKKKLSLAFNKTSDILLWVGSSLIRGRNGFSLWALHVVPSATGKWEKLQNSCRRSARGQEMKSIKREFNIFAFKCATSRRAWQPTTQPPLSNKATMSWKLQQHSGARALLTANMFWDFFHSEETWTEVSVWDNLLLGSVLLKCF